MKTSLLLLASIVFLSTNVTAQDFTTVQDDEWCENDRSNRSNRDRHCEVWETTIASGRDVIHVDAGQNGSIKIEAWDKNEIMIRARVQGWARSKQDAENIVAEVEIETGRIIRSNTPRSRNNTGAAVSYHIFVPKNSNLDLETFNGGIYVAEVSGDIRFDAMNGGIKLVSLSGNVKGGTTNGAVRVELHGTEWIGDEMDVHTTNGSVLFLIPEKYNANLVTGTVNGSLDFDFPVTVSGRMNRSVSATIGDGGKTVKAMTTNGTVKLKYNMARLSSQ